MAFSKSFPRTTDKSAYPKWEEIFLSKTEEKEMEEKANRDNYKILSECIDEARKLMLEKGLKPFQTNLISLAIALFEKRASHTVYYKERAAKEKFDSQ